METNFSSKCKIFTLSHLAMIVVTGEDRAKFLQGQLTCDIYSLTESRAAVAAFCNAKGRVISSLLVIKTAEAFWLILPADLLDTVIKKLQVYILRSSVKLSRGESLSLFGLLNRTLAENELEDNFGLKTGSIATAKIPWCESRYLCIAKSIETANSLLEENRCDIGTAEQWAYLDLSSGFPWFDASQSELYIPQMLNLDGLEGISFNKGCYTGQEIIARTHYLGKSKRNLFLAECGDAGFAPASGTGLLDGKNGQNVGSILCAQSSADNTRILAVLQAGDVESMQLILDDGKQTAIKLAHFQ